MIFVKGLAGAILAVIAMWAAILYVYTQRLNAEAKRQGFTGDGLRAVAGGWTLLLHTPSVLLLLTVAFGVGLYVTTRLSK
ncbi:MAG: hypothetical protein JO187_03210 [Acidobacteria bacterium]|nr:hypothetical protein [Acidobacteriota bacterium]